jgi:hypothetical protein
MLTSHIRPGKLVSVLTLGSIDSNKAPSLEFRGFFESESLSHYKEGCIELVYDGKVAVQNSEGKILGFENGAKKMTIPRRIVKSIVEVKSVLV